MQSHNPSFTRSVVSRWLGLSCILATLAFIPACQGDAVTHTLTGKVTLDGKNVEGTIDVIGPDGKVVGGAINDGAFTVANPPKGQCKVIMRGMPGIEGPAPKDQFAKPLLDKGHAESKIGKGVPPPAKYADATTSGLTVEIKGSGQEKKDFTLTP